MKNLGTVIREKRLDLNLTSRAFCKLSGIDTSLLSSFENDYKRPSLAELQSIAEALNVDLQSKEFEYLVYLMGEEMTSAEREIFSRPILKDGKAIRIRLRFDKDNNIQDSEELDI